MSSVCSYEDTIIIAWRMWINWKKWHSFQLCTENFLFQKYEAMCFDTKLFTNIQNGIDTAPDIPVGNRMIKPNGVKSNLLSNTTTGVVRYRTDITIRMKHSIPLVPYDKPYFRIKFLLANLALCSINWVWVSFIFRSRRTYAVYSSLIDNLLCCCFISIKSLSSRRSSALASDIFGKI